MFATFRGYRFSWLSGDLAAGVVLAAIAVPEQIATARLAGLPPEAGLYAFAAGSLAFAAFGANRFLSAGADSTIAPIFASAVAATAAVGSARYAESVAVVALLAGALLVLAGWARAGWIADLLSVPVTVGFLAGISVHVIAGQLPLIFGIPATDGPPLVRIASLISHASEANRYCAIIGFSVLALTLAAQRINARIPGPLIGLAASGIAVAAFHLHERGVPVLGALSARPPAMGLPAFGHGLALLPLVPVSLIVALICMVQTAAVLRAYPAGGSGVGDISRDFTAIGLGCIAAGFSGTFAVDASPPRTAAAAASGARSQLASAIAVLLVAALVLFASGLAAFLPLSAFGGVLVYIALRLIRTREVLRIARAGAGEIWLVAAAALLVVVFSIQTGVLLAIVLSLLQGLYVTARPATSELVRVPGTTVWWPPNDDERGAALPRVLVFAAAAPIAFINAQYVVDDLEKRMAAAPHAVRLVVVECGGVLDIDYTGALVWIGAIAALRAANVRVAFARLAEQRAQRAAQRTGLAAALGPGCIFKSVEEATSAFEG